MKLPFLRTPQHQDEPTVVAMTGVRLGDKVHFWGARPALLLPLAARSGLSGQVTVISPDAADLVSAAEREGLLVDSASAPLPDAGYDLAVVHTEGAWTSTLEPLLDATRAGRTADRDCGRSAGRAAGSPARRGCGNGPGRRRRHRRDDRCRLETRARDRRARRHAVHRRRSRLTVARRPTPVTGRGQSSTAVTECPFAKSLVFKQFSTPLFGNRFA